MASKRLTGGGACAKIRITGEVWGKLINLQIILKDKGEKYGKQKINKAKN